MDDQEQKAVNAIWKNAKARLVDAAGIIGALSGIAAVFNVRLRLSTDLIPYLTAVGIIGLSYHFSRATNPDGSLRYTQSIRVSALVMGIIATAATAGFLVRTIVGSYIAQNYIRGLQTIANDAAAGKRFLYAVDQKNNSISAYQIVPTGALREIQGSPFPTGAIPWGIAANPTGTFAYVTNGVGTNEENSRPSTVSAYGINATSGVLTPVPGSPFRVTGRGSAGMALDPEGRFAYVVNIYSRSHLGDVSAYTINNDGALTEVAGSPFPAGGEPESMAVDPMGRFVYVPNTLYNVLSAYTIDPSSGALKEVPGSPFPTRSVPAGVAVDATGKFVYVSNANSSTISTYAIDAPSGSLKQVGETHTSRAPSRVAADPVAGFIYVSNNATKSVSAYSIDPTTGALNDVLGSPFPAGDHPGGVAVDPAGQFAYVANAGSGDISAYSINATSGALKQIPGSPFKAGGVPVEIVATRAPAPAPGNVYVADASNDVVKEVLAGGGADPKSVKAFPGAFVHPAGIAVDQHGDVYVTDPAPPSVAVITAASGYHDVKSLGSGFVRPTGIAVDSLGDVYVTESYSVHGDGAVKELVAVRGSIPVSTTPITLGSGYDNPLGVAADTQGNLYVADTDHGLVKKIVAVHGIIPTPPKVVTLSAEFGQHCYNCPINGPAGVAVDARGDLYVADILHGAVQKLVADRGSVPISAVPVMLASGFDDLSGIAVDSQSNVYVTDGNVVKEILAASGYKTVKTIGSGFSAPAGVAVR